MPIISAVTTLYKSECHIAEFHKRMTETISAVTSDYEIILVNDGSPDNSLDLAAKLSEQDPHVIVVDLSRNFGHHKAIMTGLAHANGDHVFLIDSDLEEEPEWLVPFQEKMNQENCDVVYGVQEKRKGGWFERWSGQLFYFLYQSLAGSDFPKNITTARLMTKAYVASLVQHQERELMLGGLFHIVGYNQVSFPVTKKKLSETTYSLSHRLSLLTNAIVSFSSKPLVYIFYLGLVTALISFLFIIQIFLGRFLFGQTLLGWASLIASVWFLGGLIILCLGVIGIYISKIFTETKNRPYTIIKKIYKR